ncbi:pilus assembly protein PilM [Lachnospira multipara]|uniref:pilus assembly protein PilM n=1 Tax=Lachnospira multipara TaxID=28051 RepID=UPI0004193F4F|nr:pilus assembly protein PilM [Lachnospira multipara]
MAFVKVKGKLISAVLNNEFIKMMEVSLVGKQIHVYRAVTIETPKDCVNDGILTDLDKIAKAMQNAMLEKGFESSNICFSVSSTKIATKEIVIPNLPNTKIAKLVEANASEYFPVNISDYIVEYSIVDRFNEDGASKLKLMLAALNLDTAKSYYELAKKLGLNLSYIDYTGNSAYQLVKHQINSDCNLVVEIENDGTVVNIFKNNVLKLQRIVPYGKSLLVDAVMEEFDLTYEAALLKLQNEELLQSEFDGDAITESLRYLIGNINRIMDYYTSRNKGDEIAKAYVLGNAITIKGFNELLSNEIKKEVTNLVDLNNVICDKKTAFEKRRLNSYLNNLGALIEPVNFIPKDIEKEVVLRGELKPFKLILGLSIIVTAVLIIYPLTKNFYLVQKEKNLNKSISQKSEISEIVNEYYDAKDAYLDAKAFKNLTVSSDDELEKLVSILEKNLPADVVIKNMTVSNGYVTISATASSKLSIAAMITQLTNTSGISNVELPSIQESKNSLETIVLSFSVSFNFSDLSDES